MTTAIFAQNNLNPWQTYIWLLIIAIGGFTLIVSIFLAKYFKLWIQAKMTQANVTIWELVGMSFRKVNPNIMVRSKIMACWSRPLQKRTARPSRPWKPTTSQAATCPTSSGP